MCGDETDEYLDDVNNSGIYEVNTIANYDKSIIGYLDRPIGTILVRINDNEFKEE